MKKYILYSVIIFLNVFNVYSQKIKIVSGFAQVKWENNLSRIEAYNQALQLAKINAIESAFGTYIEQEANIKIENGYTDFYIIGNTKVRADWLETIKSSYKENRKDIKNEGGPGLISEIWITCEVKGKVREIIEPKLSLKAVSLNCPSEKCRTTTFLSGEQLYLNFVSPIDGYLSVYIIESEKVYRLIPYSDMEGDYVNSIPIKADKEYIFFSRDLKYDYYPGFSVSNVDELVLSTKLHEEHSSIYVIFSPVPFTKPMLSKQEISNGLIFPKSLMKSDFENWFKENRIYNNQFSFSIINIEIIGQ